MPTDRPRYVFADTGELSEMLDAAQRRWPEIHDRKQLLIRLVTVGSEAIEGEASARRRAVEETAGELSGVYRPAEQERLREDWRD
jgi:hypothetical protein